MNCYARYAHGIEFNVSLIDIRDENEKDRERIRNR